MEFLRSIAIAVLLFGLLPWGAHARAPTLPAQLPVLTASAAVGASASTAVDDHRMANHAAPMKRKCRVAHLLGSPCGPDVSLAAGSASPDLPPSRNRHRAGDTPLLTGVQPQENPDPPRSR
jgi:hypothetical protein